MTLSSRHRIRNSSPGGLRPSTLPLGHGGSPQYWLSHVDGEETFFVSFKPPRPGTEPRTWKAAVLTTTLGPRPTSRKTTIEWEHWVRENSNRGGISRCCDEMRHNYICTWDSDNVEVVGTHKLTLLHIQANTKHLYNIYTTLYYNVGPMLKTLGRRCIKVIQLFCVCWDMQGNIFVLINYHDYYVYSDNISLVQPWDVVYAIIHHTYVIKRVYLFVYLNRKTKIILMMKHTQSEHFLLILVL